MTETILVTGGAGFIGSNFILQWLREEQGRVINVDKLTYAGNPDNLRHADPLRYELVRADMGDGDILADLLQRHRPRAVLNFAAESHVDRSIHGPADFIATNVVATFRLLESVRTYWAGILDDAERASFRFLHVSTDEVFGSLGPDDPAFNETTPYAPNSPYSASKAASDHLVRAWHHTYGLPTLTTNCSNNYGPLHFPEKLIPLIILNALEGKPLPVYGDGQQVRDWLYVEDHCRAIRHVLAKGQVGGTYNIGGCNEQKNIDVVHKVCDLLDEYAPRENGKCYREQIIFVKDRPGHDRRYAIDASRMARELDWQPVETFASGLRKTVRWYLENPAWVANVKSGAYRDWVNKNYAERI